MNGGESSSDLCTVKRAAGAGLVTQANKGAVAKASKVSEATCCTCMYMRACILTISKLACLHRAGLIPHQNTVLCYFRGRNNSL